jgi:hypothetical protein
MVGRLHRERLGGIAISRLPEHILSCAGSLKYNEAADTHRLILMGVMNT